MSSSSGGGSISSSGQANAAGQQLVYNPNGLWTIWALAQIYTGLTSTNVYVPKVNDYVVDYTAGEWFKVTAIDPTTLIPTLTVVTEIPFGTVPSNDILLGVGPGPQSETYLCYVDKSTMPYKVTVDQRLDIFGTASVSAKIFLGSDLSGTGQVISAFYDQSGTLLSNVIPLEAVVSTEQNNVNVKTVPQCYTTSNLTDNEVVTVVFYDVSGSVTSKRQLLIENTAWIAASNRGQKYVTGISLIGPFMSNSDPLLLEYPLNVMLNGLSLLGKVSYSDGSSLTLPIDGVKFQLLGLQQYMATQVGQQFNFVLKYNLTYGSEFVYGSTAVNSQRFITQAYKGVTIPEDGAYTVKLYGFPVWVPANNNYTLRWYLYNLDRQLVYDVTPYVVISGTTPFNPVAYGILQNLNVSVNLQQVNGSYQMYNYAQTIGIVLNQQGVNSEGTTDWTIQFTPNQNPPFGVSNFAKTTYVSENITTVDITCGQTTQAAWINQLYTLGSPLWDPNTELAPPTPNMFTISYSGQDFEYPISQWNVVQQVGIGILANDTLFIKFIYRSASNDTQLGIAGIPVWQQN